MHSVLFWNNKGGVGKTTSAAGFARQFAAAHSDALVVAIDLDPQADLSTCLIGAERVAQLCDSEMNPPVDGERLFGEGEVPQTTAGWMSSVLQRHTVRAERFLTHTEQPNLFLVSGDPALAALASALTPQLLVRAGAATSHFRLWTNRLQLLFGQLSAVVAAKGLRYLLAVMDTGAYAGPEAALAMASAQTLVVPSSGDRLSLDAMGRAVRLFEQVHGKPLRAELRSALRFNNVWAERASEEPKAVKDPRVVVLGTFNNTAAVAETAGRLGLPTVCTGVEDLVRLRFYEPAAADEPAAKRPRRDGE